MKKPGRPSLGDIEAAIHRVVDPDATPALSAPDTLSTELQSRVNYLIGCKPDGFFQECDMGLLIMLATHHLQADRISQELQTLPVSDEQFGKLLSLAAGESARALAISRALRIPPQSRYRPDDPKTAALPSNRPKPWEFRLEDERNDAIHEPGATASTTSERT